MSAIDLNNLNNLPDSKSTSDLSNGKQLSPSSSYTPSQRVPHSDSTLEERVQHQVQQHQLFLHRQNSLRLSNYIKKKNDFESKINRL